MFLVPLKKAIHHSRGVLEIWQGRTSTLILFKSLWSCSCRFDMWQEATNRLINPIRLFLSFNSATSATFQLPWGLPYCIRFEVWLKACISDARPQHKWPHSPDLSSRSPSCPPRKQAVKKTCLCRQPVHKNKWYYQPLKTKINSIPTNHRQGAGVVGFCARACIVGAEGGQLLILSGARMAESIPKRKRRRRVREYQRVFSKTRISIGKAMERWKELK